MTFPPLYAGFIAHFISAYSSLVCSKNRFASSCFLWIFGTVRIRPPPTSILIQEDEGAREPFDCCHALLPGVQAKDALHDSFAIRHSTLQFECTHCGQDCIGGCGPDAGNRSPRTKNNPHEFLNRQNPIAAGQGKTCLSAAYREATTNVIVSLYVPFCHISLSAGSEK